MPCSSAWAWSRRRVRAPRRAAKARPLFFMYRVPALQSLHLTPPTGSSAKPRPGKSGPSSERSSRRSSEQHLVTARAALPSEASPSKVVPSEVRPRKSCAWHRTSANWFHPLHQNHRVPRHQPRLFPPPNLRRRRSKFHLHQSRPHQPTRSNSRTLILITAAAIVLVAVAAARSSSRENITRSTNSKDSVSHYHRLNSQCVCSIRSHPGTSNSRTISICSGGCFRRTRQSHSSQSAGQ